MEILRQAAKYVETHPKEFAGLDQSLHIPRAIFLEAKGQITFEKIEAPKRKRGFVTYEIEGQIQFENDSIRFPGSRKAQLIET